MKLKDTEKFLRMVAAMILVFINVSATIVFILVAGNILLVQNDVTEVVAAVNYYGKAITVLITAIVTERLTSKWIDTVTRK